MRSKHEHQMQKQIEEIVQEIDGLLHILQARLCYFEQEMLMELL
jgi:hypothetical protein